MKVSPDNQHPVKVGGEKTKRLSRKNIVIILVFLVICVGGFIGYGLYVQSQAKKHIAWTPYDDKQKKEIQNIYDEGKALVDGGKTDQATALLDARVDATKDQEVKSALLLNKAMIYRNQNDLNQALKYALEAETYHKTWELEKIIAEIYVGMGNKEKAIEYYKKSIQYNDSRSMMYESDNAHSNNKISGLSK